MPRTQVSKIILGVMQYGSGQDWMIADHEEGILQLKYAYDKGINVSRSPLILLPPCVAYVWEKAFDTANVYSAGESEVILGKFLKQHKIPRESVVILTKVCQCFSLHCPPNHYTLSLLIFPNRRSTLMARKRTEDLRDWPITAVSTGRSARASMRSLCLS